MSVDPALLKSRQDIAAARAGINPILASARGASNAVTAMLASTLNNPLKPIRFGPNIVEATTGRTSEAGSSIANNGLTNIAGANIEQPKTTIEPISTIVAKNNERIDESIDPDATQAQSIMMSKAELPQNKSKTPGPEKTFGDVEIS